MKKDRETQTEIQSEDVMEIDAEREDNMEGRIQTPEIQEKLEEILKKIENLEKKRGDKEKKEASVPWTEVVRRNKKRITQGPPSQNTRGGITQKDLTEEERERSAEVEKKKMMPLRMIKKRISRGTGIIIELHSNNQGEYENIIRRCQKEISLEELGIPPIGIKKTRTGGILFEIKCKENEEEKAEALADKIKEMVRSVEGAQVRRPLLRLRLRLTDLPFGAMATKVAEAVARIGDGRAESVRVGPLRTSVSAAGTAWADCPTQMALRAAEEAGLTLEKGGPPQCHRCLARGHLRRWCPSGVSRGACCLRCGKEGHQIGRCGQKPHCPICEERGLQADHRPGDPSECRPVPPEADREARSPRERPEKSPSSGPGEGPGGGVNWDRGASAPGGDLSPPGAEAPSSLDPGEGFSRVGKGPAAGPGDAQVIEGRPSGRLWGVDLSPSGSDMEVEPEGEGSRKRKGQDTRESWPPFPPRQRRAGRGRRRRRSRGAGVTGLGAAMLCPGAPAPHLGRDGSLPSWETPDRERPVWPR